ncbi:ABC transporter ATP-binding protein [Limimaricola cinnabarinus]|mgnify:FL=1|jgi:peptide/nickel transport system ATP-binding protein|uniref:Oligopeptide transport ATP-binding protein OppD n=1 Tax=Limimaricola cinnabarinus LL-001 TaxID=1337093 RepID=U2YPL1_9RHOB|nr:ABC transporter ATP-binding protein [Limimaricola cinnabarinus]GAD57311.1 oligopeptide transport ATP-binding protein OppD [Limimaricola cinnabarinus LL-001]
MAEPLLDVKNLQFRFRGQDQDVVQDVSFRVGRNETLCIVGESGCGKSVTALALMGLLPKDDVRFGGGEVRFDGESFAPSDQGRIAQMRGDRMAMIFQEPMTSLNPAFRIGDQIAEAVERHRQCGRAAARARALEMLAKVGIPAPEQRLDEYPHQLSGGMRQRVMIAMALANDPELLIADEPTTALDVTVQAQILDLIAELQAETGMGTIMITHDLGVVAEIATDVAVMYAGQVVEYGPAEAIFNDPQHPYTIGLMASVPTLTGPRRRLSTVPGSVPSIGQMPEGCRFSSRCPFAAPVCGTRPPLRDITPGHRAACHFAPLELHLERSA